MRETFGSLAANCSTMFTSELVVISGNNFMLLLKMMLMRTVWMNQSSQPWNQNNDLKNWQRLGHSASGGDNSLLLHRYKQQVWSIVNIKNIDLEVKRQTSFSFCTFYRRVLRPGIRRKRKLRGGRLFFLLHLKNKVEMSRIKWKCLK